MQEIYKQDAVYTPSEVAKIMKISTQTLRRWDKSGAFAARKNPTGTRKFYTVEDLTRLKQGFSVAEINNK